MVFNPLHMFISLIFVGPFDWQTTELSGTVSETLQTTQCSMPPSLSLQPREGEEQMALATSRNRLMISTTNSQCPPSPPVTRVECQGPPGEARPPALLTRPAHAQLQHRYCHSPEPGLSLLGLVPDPRGALEIEGHLEPCTAHNRTTTKVHSCPCFPRGGKGTASPGLLLCLPARFSQMEGVPGKFLVLLSRVSQASGFRHIPTTCHRSIAQGRPSAAEQNKILRE
ncbi:uncharacterized protein LOC111091799 isoform X1 [Canis lupus familiaris]|uniref:uncharacterized protein LOC111091799 isoform X1 n=2 Tax=Canis lupus familiaris TaxID=9615 RepID=UPI0018F4026B|nr:uncharacterized protein LOC111091799 isoform X1 [Canis lupus familiaris]